MERQDTVCLLDKAVFCGHSASSLCGWSASSTPLRICPVHEGTPLFNIVPSQCARGVLKPKLTSLYRV